MGLQSGSLLDLGSDESDAMSWMPNKLPLQLYDEAARYGVGVVDLQVDRRGTGS
jgi:hypothetical protein